MDLMTWNDKLSVGIQAIDADHKKLVAMANDLHYGIQAGQSNAVVADILAGLVHHTQTHFAREEAFFAKTGYADAGAHKKQHDEMAAWALEMRAKGKRGLSRADSLEATNFLKDWLYDHIEGTDKLCAAPAKIDEITAIA